MTARLVSAIDTRAFGGDTVRLGDLNRDGVHELLFVQSDPCTRSITCLTATDLFGKVLWQAGTPLPDNGSVYSDLAVQIYDWDGDGSNEVLWVEQAIYAESIVWDYALEKHIIVPTTRRGELNGHKGWAQEGAKRYEETAVMHVLDGATGKEKTNFQIPAPADDCFAFANLTGGPRRNDLVVKDRYWNMWGISHEGQVLWHYAKSNPGHYPAVADVDGDGRDEVFIGWNLIDHDHDGTILWTLPGAQSHQDSVHMVRLNGELRLIFSHGEGEGLNGGVHCLAADGKELWAREFGHAQIVVPGQFRPDLGPVQFAVADIGWVQNTGPRKQPAIVILDQDGRELSRKPYPDGASLYMVRIDWLGDGAPHCLALAEGGPFDPAIRKSRMATPVIQNAAGKTVERVNPTLPGGRETENYTVVMAHDVWGDSREELLIAGRECFNIYTNADLLPRETLYNATFYNGR